MKFLVLSTSNSKEEWTDAAVSTYLTKINPFVKIEVIIIKSNSQSRDDKNEKVNDEGKKILKELDPNDFVILLDETGKNLNSEQWAKETEKLLNSGKKRVVWIIGGAFGVSDEIKKRANLKLCLAPFVMNHLVAKTVLLEQIYRSFTILKNIPYHNK